MSAYLLCLFASISPSLPSTCSIYFCLSTSSFHTVKKTSLSSPIRPSLQPPTPSHHPTKPKSNIHSAASSTLAQGHTRATSPPSPAASQATLQLPPSQPRSPSFFLSAPTSHPPAPVLLVPWQPAPAYPCIPATARTRAMATLQAQVRGVQMSEAVQVVEEDQLPRRISLHQAIRVCHRLSSLVPRLCKGLAWRWSSWSFSELW